jgi:tetratricopeptide (TPR) repeat protein
MASSAISIEEILGLAIRHANAGHRERARVLCEQADATHPAHPAVQQLLAVLNLQEGDTAQASRHAEASLALRPDHVPTLLVAGDAARAAGAIDKALTHYARAHELQPDRSGICLSLGISQHRCGQLRPALQTLERAASLAPDHADTLFQLALVQQDLRDLNSAARTLQRVLQLSPTRADAEMNLGVVLQDSGRIDEAMRAYGRAYNLREDSFGRIAHALAASNVGRIWLDLDELRAALRSSQA